MKYITPIRIAIIKNINVGEYGEKGEFFYNVFLKYKLVQLMWKNNMEVPHNINRTYLKEIKSVSEEISVLPCLLQH